MNGKIRATLDAGETRVRFFISHVMESGNRRDPATGTKIPRYFVRAMRCEHNGREVLSAVCNWGMANNPYLSFAFSGGEQGDAIKVYWEDDRGATGILETRIA